MVLVFVWFILKYIANPVGFLFLLRCSHLEFYEFKIDTEMFGKSNTICILPVLMIIYVSNFY